MMVENKSKLYGVRFNPSQSKEIERLALSRGVWAVEFIRKAVLRAIRKAKRKEGG